MKNPVAPADPQFPVNSRRRNPVIRFMLLAVVLGNGSLHAADRDSDQRPMVLAHYMPWFVGKPESDHWGWHWTMNRFDPDRQGNGKREIASHYYPLIGPYDSGDRNVIEYHLLLMKLAGIEGVVVDWYGRTDFRDYPLLHRNTTRVLQTCERMGMKFVICYEDQTIPALIKAGKLQEDRRVAHAVDEINWLSKYWFKSGAYVRLKKKPLLLSFGHAGLTDDEWSRCLTDLETPVAYFSEHRRRSGAAGAYDWPMPKQGLEAVERFGKSAGGSAAAIPVVFPRFHDIYQQAGVSDGYGRIQDNSGRTLRATLIAAEKLRAPIIQIATWNDWGEGTQIEPGREFGYRDLKIISQHLSGTSPPSDQMIELPSRLLNLRRTGVSAEIAEAIIKEISEGREQKAVALVRAAEAAGK